MQKPGAGDAWGGMAAAAVVLPQAMAFGVALATLAGLPAAQGAMMGLIGAAILSTSAGVIGCANGLISAPTGPALVLLSGTTTALMASGLQGAALLPALAAVTILAGIMQMLIGLSGGGTLVKFIPYPVVAGFMTGSALLMFKSQFGPLSGRGVDDVWEDWRWLPACVAFATLLLVHYGPRLIPAVPGVIAGLVGGTVLFHVATMFGPGEPPAQWLIGGLPRLAVGDLGLDLNTLGALPWQVIAISALAFALLTSINTLLVAVISDVTTETRHNSARELFAQGVGMLATGCAGGMGGSATTGATLVALRAGGRRWAALVCGLAFVVMVLVGGGIGRALPIAVLSGIIVSVAVHMLERDLPAWLKRRRTRMDGIITLVVTTVTVAYDLVAAIAVGVAIAIILFMRAQIRAPVVHRRSTGIDLRSVRARTQAERELLAAHGDRIVLYELRGNLFFATADRLYEELMPDLCRPAWVILHLRRVSQVDLTGVKILQQMAVQIDRNGGQLLFCNVHWGIGLGHRVEETLRTVSPTARFVVQTFNGLDEALEHAEDALLDEVGAKPTVVSRRLELAANELGRSLTPARLEHLAAVCTARSVAAGETVFAVGEHGDQLYAVLQGEVDILLPTTAHHHKRLAKCGPGTFFGELAFIEPGPRAAAAIAITPAELLIFDRAAFDRLADAHPHTAIAVLLALGGEQVAHQRWSTAEIRRLSEW
ncbi:MAG: SLC26A/SulP transporter family protein [Gammaproteobacteria bacterium]|nr:SLC26A/SulP transporter family protein [Gammaproteobacteria bacterium]